MEIFKINEKVKKRFSPSKLVPDFARRYKQDQNQINDTKREAYSFFKLANKRIKSNKKNQIEPISSDLSIPKKHTNVTRSNMSSTSGSGEFDAFDSNRILAIIAKEKYETYNNLSESKLEDNFNKNLINSRYLSTPFDDLITGKPLNFDDGMTSFDSGSQISYATNRDLYLEQKMKNDILNNKQQFRNFKINDYYFKNLLDFENKFSKKNERLLLTQTPIPPKFQGVEKFGFLDDNKKVILSPVVIDSIQKNKQLLTKINQTSRHVDGFMKLKPIEKPTVFPEERDLATPPLLSFYNNRNIDYNKSKFVRLKSKQI